MHKNPTFYIKKPNILWEGGTLGSSVQAPSVFEYHHFSRYTLRTD